MKLRNFRDAILQQEDINFLLTNRVPRIALTRFMGWFSQLRHPWVSKLSIGAWRLFAELDLSDARQQTFKSLHECFVRELKPGARPIEADPGILCSPCDAIVGACGPVEANGQVYQAKGFPYQAGELFGDEAAAAHFVGGQFVTLRLTSSMYHRFHAPHDLKTVRVTHMAGDTWNVNPIALRRIERLFCRNERALIEARLVRGGHRLAMVPVAAILVAGLRLHCIDLRLGLGYRGPRRIDCHAAYAKGDEMGWFEHGSTIIVFAPKGFTLAAGIAPGHRVRMGEALMRLPSTPAVDVTMPPRS